MKAIPTGITVQQLRFRHTTADGFLGDPLIVVSFLFFGFAVHANGLVIVD
jgi:hypothetical protein